MERLTRLRAGISIIVCAFAVSLSGCATMFGSSAPSWEWDATERPADQPAYRTPEQISQPLDGDETAVIASARTLVGRPPDSTVMVKGRTFVLDCIGTVSAIFYGVDIDVQRDFRSYGGNGVNRLYQSLKALRGLHRDLYPRPGDVIFWDNTWDANGDGNLGNDPRTHAGVVMSVDQDGTIRYVHEHIVKGVIVESMNLLHPGDYYGPQGRIINNAIAMNSGISRRTNPPRWTSGELWNSFGDVLRVKRHFAVAEGPPDPDPPAEILLAMRPPSAW